MYPFCLCDSDTCTYKYTIMHSAIHTYTDEYTQTRYFIVGSRQTWVELLGHLQQVCPCFGRCNDETLILVSAIGNSFTFCRWHDKIEVDILSIIFSSHTNFKSNVRANYFLYPGKKPFFFNAISSAVCTCYVFVNFC